jgi:hypothetical protein
MAELDTISKPCGIKRFYPIAGLVSDWASGRNSDTSTVTAQRRVIHFDVLSALRGLKVVRARQRHARFSAK